MTWFIAVYWPEHDPEVLHLMSEAGWFQFVGDTTVLAVGLPRRTVGGAPGLLGGCTMA
jgi:hypothetical protein